MQTPGNRSKGCRAANKNIKINFWKVKSEVNIYVLHIYVLPIAHLKTEPYD